MAAPLLIINKAVRINQEEIQIMLSSSARDDDISLFFRLCLNVDGSEEQLILVHIKNKAESDSTTCSDLMHKIRTEKKCILLINKPVSFLEFYAHEKKHLKKTVFVE